MSKNLKNLKWETVALEGFPASVTNNLDGFVGLEECTDYGLEKESKRPKKKKVQNKRKNSSESSEKEVPKKKVKLSNGFVVENVNLVTPSMTTEQVGGKSKKKKINKPKKKLTDTTHNKENVKMSSKKKSKPKLGEDISQTVCDLTPEDMLSWAEFKLPDPILKALAELGFKNPTKIQQLSLPAAIHGRRDILGAAETGSGKTLAFGLPILSGIMKIKEKIDKGFDPYDIQFKKSSNKKKQHENNQNNTVNNKNKKNKYEKNNKKQESKLKESSEDGYSSSAESEDEEKQKVIKEKPTKKVNQNKIKNAKTEDEFIKEYDVPLRKKPSSVEEENDSDDSGNYIHLSEILDSDDLADSSDDEKVDESEGDNKTGENGEVSDSGISGKEADEDSGENSELTEEEGESDDENDEGSDDEMIEKADDGSDDEMIEDEEGSDEDAIEDEEGSDEDAIEDDADENEQGIGCVKVIDNIDMPGPTSTKTGKPLYALIVTPTRELAIQISQHLRAVAKYTGIRIATIVGGMAAVKQERVLRAGPEVVVATPGRLWELLGQGTPHLQQMEYVKFLAIDETDRMLERAHFEELTPLLERLNANEAQAAARQNFVFSATLTMVHDLPTHMLGKKVTKRGKILNRKVQKMTPQQKINKLINIIGMTEPKVVDITQQNSGTADSLTECRITCAFDQKDAYLYYILTRHPGRTIVFCNAIGCVKRLAQLLSILKCHPLPLHASMQQRQRLKNLERFRDDPRGVLVATDVAARGLDIPGVDHVIHYQVPKTAENYVHRSGRTARATKEGLTILMMEPAEGYLYSKLCRTLNKTSEVPLFPVPAASISPFKDIVNVARDIDALELKKRRATQAAGWRDKAAREMDMILDDDDVPVAKVDTSIEKALKAKKRQLDKLLSRPMFPRGFSYKYPSLNDSTALTWSDENALQVMKKALESGELKKEKRKSKNAPLLKLQKDLNKLK